MKVTSITVDVGHLCWMWIEEAYLLPSIATPLSTAIGFYYWKAKAENLLKIQKALKPEKPKRKKAGDNSAAQLRETLQQGMDRFFAESLSE